LYLFPLDKHTKRNCGLSGNQEVVNRFCPRVTGVECNNKKGS